MKKIPLILLAASLVAVGSAGNSDALTIIDKYIGADPTDSGLFGEDIVGSSAIFEVYRMDVNLVDDQFVVDIRSEYFRNVGKSNTAMGDLFISTNGWNPRMPTELDNFYNPGETWEFVVALDRHRGANAGNVGLYELDQANYGSDILLSEDFAFTGAYRAGQEVQYAIRGPFGGLAPGMMTTGDWSINDDMLRISIDAMGLGWDFSDVDSLGFHWTMTCANDVIEGGAPVPEPGTVFLFGAGLLAMAFAGRKRWAGSN